MALSPSSSRGGTSSGVASYNTRTGAVTSQLSDVTTVFTAAGQVIQGTGSGAGGLALPPGFEFGYDQITANVTVTSTVEATGTTIIAAAAHTFDGGLVLAHFFTPELVPPNTVGTQVFVSLFEGATQIGRIATMIAPAAAVNGVTTSGFLRFTPSAASHTYTVTAHMSAGANALVVAGAGGTATFLPAFLRFTKV